MIRASLLFVLFAAALAARPPLVVVSVDGLDWRYLKGRDQYGLKIPNIRRLLREGQAADGVLGVFPTVTWPSHTTLITGVDPVEHGIQGNQRPKAQGGDYYWSSSLIQTPTLIVAAHQAGLTVAAITWPVTVDAPVDWNLPEYFKRRRGGEMDLASIESKEKPDGLVKEITQDFASFPQEWMDDRTRVLAALYLIRRHHPDLLLVHLVDLDSEEHDNAPFTRASFAMLERTDELIGQVLSALPPNASFALVSDHGFERVNTVANLQAAAARDHIPGITAFGGIVAAKDEAGAEWLRRLAKDPQYGVGREIPPPEIARFPSALHLEASAAVFESAPGFVFFGPPSGEIFSKPAEIGNHGHWPTRYRAVFVLSGPGISPAELPEMSMKQIAHRLAAVLGVSF